MHEKTGLMVNGVVGRPVLYGCQNTRRAKQKRRSPTGGHLFSIYYNYKI